MSQQIKCQSCGASMEPSKIDGRTHQCPYCGAVVQVAVDAAQIAAGLRVDLNNVNAFLEGLAKQLGALSDRTKVVRDGNQIVVFEINLDPDLYVAKREGHAVVGQYKKLVRGVALKTATHPLDRWLDMLITSLAARAGENQRIAEALRNR